MTSTNTLALQLENVCDRASFIDFVRALAEDRREEIRLEKREPSSPYGPGANGWENPTIDTFLDASVAWADDVSGLTDDRAEWFPENPSWHAFAVFLFMGKIYE